MSDILPILHTFSPAFTAACGKKLLGFSVLLKRMASWRKKRSSMGVVVTDVTGCEMPSVTSPHMDDFQRCFAPHKYIPVFNKSPKTLNNLKEIITRHQIS